MKPEIFEHLLGMRVYTDEDTYDKNIDYINVNCTFYINSSIPPDVASRLNAGLEIIIENTIRPMLGVENKNPYDLSEEIEQNKKFDRESKL